MVSKCLARSVSCSRENNGAIPDLPYVKAAFLMESLFSLTDKYASVRLSIS
jgi:hypothetical protein